MSVNLATIPRESAKSALGKPLMHFADRSWAYAEVDETSGRVAASLLASGLRPGETVAAYRYPRAVHILDDLPRNATGKVLETELRAR